MEDKINTSHKNFLKKFNLSQNIKQESKKIEKMKLSDIKNKYKIESKEPNLQNDLLKSNYDEFINTVADFKEEESLRKYVANCHYYGYQTNINIEDFQNKSFKNFITNTSNMEFLDKSLSPNNLTNILEENTLFRSYKNGHKNQSIDSIDSGNEDRIKDLNYLAETKFVEEMQKLKEINEHNQNIINEYERGEDLIETDHVLFNNELLMDHLQNSLDSDEKRKLYKESLGLSLLDNKENLQQSVLFNNRASNENSEMFLQSIIK